MSHENIKAAFADAVSHVVSNISQYAASPHPFRKNGG